MTFKADGMEMARSTRHDGTLFSLQTGRMRKFTLHAELT